MEARRSALEQFGKRCRYAHHVDSRRQLAERGRKSLSRGNAGDQEERRGGDQDKQDGDDRQRPGAMSGAFPWRHRKPLQKRLLLRSSFRRNTEPRFQPPAALAFGEMPAAQLRIFEILLAVSGHTGSRYPSNSSFRRLRARNSLFLTVPRGIFFSSAISSYDSSAKCRN